MSTMPSTTAAITGPPEQLSPSDGDAARVFDHTMRLMIAHQYIAVSPWRCDAIPHLT